MCFKINIFSIKKYNFLVRKYVRQHNFKYEFISVLKVIFKIYTQLITYSVIEKLTCIRFVWCRGPIAPSQTIKDPNYPTQCQDINLVGKFKV